MNTALDIISITGPIYLIIAIGFIATRMGLFARSEMLVFGQFTLKIALPALLFNALSKRSFGEILNLEYLAAFALGSLIVIAVALWWSRYKLNKPWSYCSMFAMGMCCPNSGFIGYPILLLTLGPIAGVALALNMIVENLLLIPLLLAIADADSSDGKVIKVLKQSFIGIAKNPMIWGISLGFLTSLSGVTVPTPIARTIDILAASSAALSLFVIGGMLVGLELGGVKKTITQIMVGKLFLHPLCIALFAFVLIPIPDPTAQIAVLISAAIPMFGTFTLLSQRHGYGSISAAALLITTVTSFFTLSVLLWVLRQYVL